MSPVTPRDIQMLDPPRSDDPREFLIDTTVEALAGLPQEGQIDANTRWRWATDSCDTIWRRLTGRQWADDAGGLTRSDRLSWQMTCSILGIEIDNLGFLLPVEVAALVNAHNGRDRKLGAPRDIVRQKLCQIPPRALTTAGWDNMGAQRDAWTHFTGPTLFWRDGGWRRDRIATDKLRGHFRSEGNPWIPAIYRRPGTAELTLVDWLVPTHKKIGRMIDAVVAETQDSVPLSDIVQTETGYTIQLWEQMRRAQRAGIKPGDLGLAIRLKDRWEWRRVTYDPDMAARNCEIADRVWTEHVLTGQVPDDDPCDRIQYGDQQPSDDLLKTAHAFRSAQYLEAAATRIHESRKAIFEELGHQEFGDRKIRMQQPGQSITFQPPIWNRKELRDLLDQEDIPAPDIGDGQSEDADREWVRQAVARLRDKGVPVDRALGRKVDYSPLKTDHDVTVTRWRDAANRSAVKAIQELDTRVDEFI
ncbi:MAG: hypothetical protein OXC53_10165 [Rhodobacteraceae bacterium]|nr:hypothetical protein [Paracoccaceae bacterium]